MAENKNDIRFVNSIVGLVNSKPTTNKIHKEATKILSSIKSASPIKDFILKNYKHFNAASLVDAAEGYSELIDKGGKMCVSLGGAMSTGELGISLAEMIRQDKVHLISCTGANLEEDIFNLVAHSHYVRIPEYKDLTPKSEEGLVKKHLNRVTDTCIPEKEAMKVIEKLMFNIWKKAEDKNMSYFPHEYLYQLLLSDDLKGKYEINPKNSWMLAAAQKNIPIVVPGWEDSSLGNIFASEVVEGRLKSSTVKSGIDYMVYLCNIYPELAKGEGIGFFQIAGGISGDFPICLHEDTNISLLNGTEVKIKDIPNGDKIWLYGCKEDGNIVPVEGVSLGKTKSDVKYTKVILDNGEVVKCTSNHKFMMRDGSYKEANLLIEGDSLMPLYRSVDKYGHELFVNNNTQEQEYTHRVVCNMVNDNMMEVVKKRIENKKDKWIVVHHADFNKRNNEPNNLVFMGENEHWRYHANIGSNKYNGLWDNYEYKEKMRSISKENMENLWRDEGFVKRLSKRSSIVMNRNWSNPEFVEKMKNILSKRNKKKRRTDINIQMVDLLVKQGIVISYDIAEQLECSRGKIKALVYEEYKLNWIDYIRQFYPDYNYREKDKQYCYNHKVVSVVEVFENSNFYDISVPSTENFALTAGVFVHNCVVPLLKLDLNKPETPFWAYFCQISDSTTSYGSYSGAVPNEKITWSKIDKDTPSFVIESDATICVPLIFGYVLNQ